MSPCKSCTAKCCRYIVLEIDVPTTKRDFENIRWFLAHRDICIIIEKRKWYLEVFNECKYLTSDHRCTIYEKRPDICRTHSLDDCEYWDHEFGHDHYFKSLEEFDAYLARKKSRKRKKKKNA